MEGRLMKEMRCSNRNWIDYNYNCPRSTYYITDQQGMSMGKCSSTAWSGSLKNSVQIIYAMDKSI